ncbi:E3 ubiquitin-protein ligase TRIM33 isoform X3 [Seriola aureovittata]|uniref:E3 ubiquitin-protein ligase TRIM33 isoform X3 n=1 Tax=Seriola aureovittata TaxID=2871759 RepID=UPI0024BE1C66|nr:E3 ubiquitin-protein ligase TRIM33 isoform X3 [Seriola aureovittata]
MSSLLNMETTGDPGNGLSQQCCSCVSSSSRCWCVDCREALCDDCVVAHRRVTVTRSHRILNQKPDQSTTDQSTTDQSTTGQSTTGEISAPPTKFCRHHPSEPLKLYCFTCYQYTCRDCQLMAHMNHRYQFVTEALVNMKKQLEAWVQPIRAQRETVRRSLQDMETRLRDIARGESQLKTELQSSYKICSEILQKRMRDILEEVKKASQSECVWIQRRMEKLKKLQEKQLLLTKTTDKARNIQELSALFTWSAHIKCQLKDVRDQDPSPPQTMSQLQVLVDGKTMGNLLNFGELKVTWIPFSVSQTSNQNTPDTSSPYPAVTPPTSTSLAPSCKTLPQTRTTNDTASLVPVQHPPSSLSSLSLPPPPKTRTSTSNQSCLPPSSCPNLNQPTQPVQSQSSSTLTLVSQQLPIRSGLSLSKALSPSCTVQLVQPAVVLNQPTLVPLITAQTQTVYQVSGSSVALYPVMPQLPQLLLCQTVSCPPVSGSCQNLPAASAENSISVGQSHTAAPNHCTLTDESSAAHTRLLASQRLICDSAPHPSSLKHQPQSTVVMAEADSACDHKVPEEAAKPQEPAENRPTSTVTEGTKPSGKPSLPKTEDRDTEGPSVGGLSPSTENKPTFMVSEGTKPSGKPSLPKTEDSDTEGPSVGGLSPSTENKPTFMVSEGTKPSGKPSLPKTEERDTEELSSVIGQQNFNLRRRQSKVSLFRLQLSQPRPGCPRPGVSLPVENIPTVSVSEEPKPSGKPSPPQTEDGDTEGPSSVIGQKDFSLSQYQPRVSLLRLPLSLPRPGRPLPGFILIPGDTEDEVYVEEVGEDSQSYVDDVSDDLWDSTDPLSSPSSPVTLQILSCSACGSAHASIICLSCSRGYHRDCHLPPVGPDIWSEWICSLCQDLSDPSDPYSSERPQSPQSPCLSLLDQRRCESLLLQLKVEGCTPLSEVGDVWSRLTLISERLTLRRSPHYRTAAEFLSDIWRLFKATSSSQDDLVLNKLQETFHLRLKETFSSELHHPPVTPPSSERGERSADLHQDPPDTDTNQSRLKDTRKRLRDFLTLMGPSGAKRTKTDKTEE